jgi:hypothetical protein
VPSTRQLIQVALLTVGGLLPLHTYGCGDSNAVVGPSSTSVTFVGRVVEFITQAPVTSATVEFRLDSQQPGPSQAMTGANGQYALTVPHTGTYFVQVDGAVAGVAHVNGSGYRGDLLVSRGTCISRYGFVIDSRTLRPVSGATAALSGITATTGADGWYRIDLGCPAVVLPGNTTFIRVTHPRYAERTAIVGRGVAGVMRLDLELDGR